MPNNREDVGTPSVDPSTLTVEEKVDLLTGYRMWRTHALPRVGLPAIVMTDGTYGVRYSIEQIDKEAAGGQDFDAFLAMMSQPANYLKSAWGTLKPATCFPNGSSFGCSWDVELAYELGAALARECQHLGVHLLLGPGINLRRTPLAGRSYEYYSEDPVVSGDIAAGLINGLQNGGVGAALKHFACNNSEVERTTMDSIVDDRALHELYLLGFERAVKKSHPWTVMSSYNRLNGRQTSESRWLLTELLRDNWGFDGLVISDWHGVKDDARAVEAGNDLDMPESTSRRRQLREAIESGSLDATLVDQACSRVIHLVQRAKAGENRQADCDFEAHHRLARRMAAESFVLLKNDGVLPLRAGEARRIAVVGQAAIDPLIQGTGSATTLPTWRDVPLEEISRAAGPGTEVVHFAAYDAGETGPDQIREAVEGCRSADVVLVFGTTVSGADGEGADRRNLDLGPGQDELIRQIAAVNRKVVVVLANPDAVLMPWLDEVAGVLDAFFAGQAMGGALADVLFGAVSPSGKLTTTFPKRVEDVPGFLTYPGENGRHRYSEGIYVGYRYYDKRAVEPLFPFGFGLSYTRFGYSDLVLDRQRIGPGEDLTLSFIVKNEGGCEGKEIYQVYLQHTKPRLQRSVRDLRGFGKIALRPGESRRVQVRLSAKDFEVFDPDYGRWVLDSDEIAICVGASSRDIRLTAEVAVEAGAQRHRPFTKDIQPGFALDNPVARSVLNEFIRRKTGASEADVDRMLDGCRGSFFGIFTTFDRRFRIDVTERDRDTLTAEINARMLEAT